MKKFGKFVVAAVSAAAFAGGAYYLVKNVINKDSSDEFDDFEDEFDDFDFNNEGETDVPATPENREYVTLNISKEEEDSQAADAQDTEAAEEADKTACEDGGCEEDITEE